MKERPILFSAPMVRALLAGTKTQTRRAIKPDWWRCLDPRDADDRAAALAQCPYGAPGDRLWVKETIRLLPEFEPESEHAVSEFSADGAITKADAWPWKRRVLPSIHMPRGLSRITLEITDVRVERLHDITDEDAIAEGVERACDGIGWHSYDTPSDVLGAYKTAGGSFLSLWGTIHGHGSVSADPWVWALTFERVTP